MTEYEVMQKKYNKVQACFVLETFYSEFSHLRALSRPARLSSLGISQADRAGLNKALKGENLE